MRILSLILLSCSFSYSQTILIVGDSHMVGPFGKKIDDLSRAGGYKTATYGSCGSIYQWWETGKETPCGYFFKNEYGDIEKGLKAKTPIFEDLLKKLKPDYVIIELGANYAYVESDDFAVKDMTEMAKKALEYKSKCFWVSKPAARKNAQAIPRILKLSQEAVLGKCEFFDSTKVTFYPQTGGDGIHYSFKEGLPIAENWAEKVFQWFEEKKDKGPIKK